MDYLVLSPRLVTWIITAIAVTRVIVRPFDLMEAIWPVIAVVILLVSGLIAPGTALAGIAKGTDVYLFLAGMMLLAEAARHEGLFGWLAALATTHANGSPKKLFLLTYIVGTVVTVFLSNDATAVVLTPAVAAAAKAADTKQPLPYLLVCAFIANAASFVLPISNPANLVIYSSAMPPLLPRYLLPSVVSISATYAFLFWTQRNALGQPIAKDITMPVLSAGGRTAAFGIVATAVALLAASALDIQLGLPTCVAGAITAAVVLIRDPGKALPTIRGVSWGILPLVAALFVLVEALASTGVIATISGSLRTAAERSEIWTGWAAGLTAALASNLANNLPVGLVAGSAVQAAHAPAKITSAVLIGVELGPNLSVTGSLATILWLNALRRDGHHIGAMKFLKIGAFVMTPALLLAIGTVLFLN
ncbi:MAG: arsenic transporter [Xanthobacteraceae bacterium]